MPGLDPRVVERAGTHVPPDIVDHRDDDDRLDRQHALAAGAQDAMQDHGYSEAAYRQLQASHLVRSVAVTIAAVWALAEVWRLPKS